MASSRENYDDLNREQIKNLPREERKELNADPITGEPGSHPVGTGLGAAGGAAAGAAIGAAATGAGAVATGAALGSTAGPVGAIVGGIVGAVAGGALGHAAAEAMDPTVEDAYWRQNYTSTPYYQASQNTISDLDYDRDYQSAYRLGYENRNRYPAHQRFEDVESDLGQSWEEVKGESRLKWEQAKQASRDAWDRLTH